MAQNTRDNILTAGMKLFSQHGFAAVATKKIAEEAGISEVTLYRHFDSKRSLFNTIIKEKMLDFGIASYVENEATYDVQIDIPKIAQMFMNSYIENKALHLMVIKDKFLKSEARTHSRKRENKDFDAVMIYFAKLKDKEIIKDDPENLMKLFLSNIHGFVLHNFVFKTPPEDEVKKQYEYFEWMINKIIEIILI